MVFRCVSEARPALGRRIPGTGAATRWGGRAATRGKGEGLAAGDRAAITLQQARSPSLCSRSGRGGTTVNKAHKVQGAALETLGPYWAQLPLRLCLSVFVSVSV